MWWSVWLLDRNIAVWSTCKISLNEAEWDKGLKSTEWFRSCFSISCNLYIQPMNYLCAVNFNRDFSFFLFLIRLSVQKVILTMESSCSFWLEVSDFRTCCPIQPIKLGYLIEAGMKSADWVICQVSRDLCKKSLYLLSNLFNCKSFK